METTPAGLKKTIFEQIRERFFYSSQATGITVVACFVLALILWRLVDWAVLDAVHREPDPASEPQKEFRELGPETVVLYVIADYHHDQILNSGHSEQDFLPMKNL